MPFADRDVLCVSCGLEFVFSAGEQEFFHEKGFINEPKHCKQCKAKRAGRQRAASNRNARHLLGMWQQHNGPIQADSGQTSNVQNVFRKQTQITKRRGCVVQN